MRFIFFTLLLLVFGNTHAQELNFEIKVQAPRNSSVDNSVFSNLEKELSNLLNDTEWTELQYEPEERIEGNLQITVTEEISTGVYRGDLIIQANRPVYNSNYSTPLISYIDKGIQFSYDGVSPISKTTDGYINNLSSIVSFYVHFVLGVDADSFELKGGDKYFKVAQEIYNNIPANLQQDDNGWSIQRNDKQNRYYMLENINSPKLKNYREAWYSYHRKGLDYMYSDYKEARAVIKSAFTDIVAAHKSYNNSIITRMFLDAKKNEIVEVFTIADRREKRDVLAKVMQIDPTQGDYFKRLKD